METNGQTMIKLWLDDIRNPPDELWTWVKTYDEALEYITKNVVSEISFDHDLGTKLTGYSVAKAIEHYAYYDMVQQMVWSIHSANPVGRKNIEQAMKSADRFWLNREDK